MFDQVLRSVHDENTLEKGYMALGLNPLDDHDSCLHGSAMNEVGFTYKASNIDQVCGLAPDHELSWIREHTRLELSSGSFDHLPLISNKADCLEMSEQLNLWADLPPLFEDPFVVE